MSVQFVRGGRTKKNETAYTQLNRQGVYLLFLFLGSELAFFTDFTQQAVALNNKVGYCSEYSICHVPPLRYNAEGA